jgi:hypothetical protein
MPSRGPGVEEALYDSAGMRQFVGIDVGREPVPDETTVCKFRHLLEEHDLGSGCLSGSASICSRRDCASVPLTVYPMRRLRGIHVARG